MDGVSLEVWSDVENPLIGPQGATAVFGPQKGYLQGIFRRWMAGLQTLLVCLMPD
jgi:glycerate kinase